MLSFHWENIKQGFCGFEKLALEYVENEYGSPNDWKHTPYTRDGNRDAYSIICGFRPNDMSPEEWWMEAKYSTKNERLTRYRIDATIVSAAIHGNVSKIIFVTNILISTKTIVDIRASLKQAIHCREVHFCDKTTLEYWLKKNPTIFQRYFPNTDIETIVLQPLFLSEGIEFFSSQKIGLSVSEPLQFLHINREYYLYFSVFSQNSMTLSLSVGEEFNGVEILSPKTLKLSSGITPCVVKLILKPEYSMQYNLADGRNYRRSDRLDGAILKLGTLELIIKTSLDVLPTVADKLYLPSQEKNFQVLKTCYETARKEFKPSINFLIGTSGTGKTYLMEWFVRECLDLEQTVFRVTFSSHPITNDLNIYYLLIFCLYPYLPPDMVDETYLNELLDIDIKQSVIYKAARCLREPDRLHQLFVSILNEDIFPNNLQLNPRVILLDDLQKLDPDSLRFLLAAISELAKKHQPIYVLANGWPEITSADSYRITKNSIFLQEFSCTLTANDLVTAINKAGFADFDFDPNICKIIFPSVIELRAFINYLKGTVLHSLEDLLIQSRLFLSGDIAKESILDRFYKLFSVDSEAEKLCNQIYWSINGVPVQVPMTETEKKLILFELVKVDDKNMRLIPFHDLYKLIFRQKFEFKFIDSADVETDIYINTKKAITVPNQDNISKAISQLQQWKAEGRFYAMLYVLEGVFETTQKNSLRYEIGDEAYFMLYLYYAFGVTNGSRTRSGRSVFEDIVKETMFISNPAVLSIRLDAIFELINSCYEWLEHEKAREYIKELKHLITALQALQQLPQDSNQCEKYVLSCQIEMLICSENEESQSEELFRKLDHTTKTYNFNYEREFFKLRYAETLYFRDTARAYVMAEECQNNLKKLCGSEDKFYLWAKMDCEYLRFVLKLPGANLKAVQDAHHALRHDFFNDYRKRLLASACIYYAADLLPNGDEILFSDISTLRDMRPRQAAFYAETMALRYALQGKFDLANKELQKAAKLFKYFPSYLTVIHHNQRILKNGLFSNSNVKFCSENACSDGSYCIDPRCIW